MSASFVRAAVRPFAAPSATAATSSAFFFNNTARQSVVRHISTSSRTASASKTAIPAFSTSSFFAALRRSTNSSRFSNFYFTAGRRFQSGSAGAADAAAETSWLKRMWDSPIGVKTVHFW